MSYGPTAPANPHKLIWLQIFACNSQKAYSVSTAEDLSSFGYFQRSTVREHLMFASRTSAERCQMGSRVTIALKEVPVSCHVLRKSDGLCAVAMTDQQYSDRVAHSMLTKLLFTFEKQFGNIWKKVASDQTFIFHSIQKLLTEYSNPRKADKMLAVQQNLDEITEIMHKNIEDILQRGETLDTLLQKSDDIGQVSKMFHSKAKKNNQCCQWI
jgi:synaptobrevin family protein YKT6